VVKTSKKKVGAVVGCGLPLRGTCDWAHFQLMPVVYTPATLNINGITSATLLLIQKYVLIAHDIDILSL
jgi:hypothetical protein